MTRFAGKTAIVTGAGRGIGRALAEHLAAAGANVVVSDINAAAAERVALQVSGLPVTCDVTAPDQIETLISIAEQRFGGVDIFISNAGFAAGEPKGPTSAESDIWQKSWDVHVMAHLHAARLVLPAMESRGEGWLVNVASAAGLLSQIGDAAYSASKHAAVSLAQSLAIAHGGNGVTISVVCPLYVATPLLGYEDLSKQENDGRLLSSHDVAATVLTGMAEKRFLILPHPEAAEYAKNRAANLDRWVEAMRHLSRKIDSTGAKDLSEIHKLL